MKNATYVLMLALIAMIALPVIAMADDGDAGDAGDTGDVGIVDSPDGTPAAAALVMNASMTSVTITNTGDAPTNVGGLIVAVAGVDKNYLTELPYDAPLVGGASITLPIRATAVGTRLILTNQLGVYAECVVV